MGGTCSVPAQLRCGPAAGQPLQGQSPRTSSRSIRTGLCALCTAARGLPRLCRAAELPPQVVASGLNKENGDYGMNDTEGDIPTGFLRRWRV